MMRRQRRFRWPRAIVSLVSVMSFGCSDVPGAGSEAWVGDWESWQFGGGLELRVDSFREIAAVCGHLGTIEVVGPDILEFTQTGWVDGPPIDPALCPLRGPYRARWWVEADGRRLVLASVDRSSLMQVLDRVGDPPPNDDLAVLAGTWMLETEDGVPVDHVAAFELERTRYRVSSFIEDQACRPARATGCGGGGACWFCCRHGEQILSADRFFWISNGSAGISEACGDSRPVPGGSWAVEGDTLTWAPNDSPVLVFTRWTDMGGG